MDFVEAKPNIHLVEGGLGKHLQFTALFDGIVEKYKENLCIISSYPTTYAHDERVASSELSYIAPVLKNNNFYFQQYNNIIFNDPYKTTNFLKGDKHIIKAWCDLYEIESEDLLPDFRIDTRRERAIKSDILKLGAFILVQFTGGQGIQNENQLYDVENLGRNYKKGQEVINLLREAMPEINIIVFGHNNENNHFENTWSFNEALPTFFYNKEDFMILAKYCLSFITIDSALQHMCSNKNFNKKGVVLWGSSSPEMFGYEKNKNLRSKYPNSVFIEPQKIVDNFLSQEMSPTVSVS